MHNGTHYFSTLHCSKPYYPFFFFFFFFSWKMLIYCECLYLSICLLCCLLHHGRDFNKICCRLFQAFLTQLRRFGAKSIVLREPSILEFPRCMAHATKLIGPNLWGLGQKVEFGYFILSIMLSPSLFVAGISPRFAVCFFPCTGLVQPHIDLA